LPEKSFHKDWMTILIILSAFLWLVVKTTTRSMLHEYQIFLFRGINESSSRDTGFMFYWQSTIMNFVSFLIIGIFAYCAAAYYDFIRGDATFLFMLISLGLVIFSITSRHFICLAAGSLSSETEAFNEY